MTFYTPSQVYNSLIGQGASSSQANTLTGIAGAESSFNDSSIGDNGTSFGLFQIHSPTWDSTFGGASSLAGAPLDTQSAAALVVANSPKGFGNWSTYNSGAYQNFVPGFSGAATGTYSNPGGINNYLDDSNFQTPYTVPGSGLATGDSITGYSVSGVNTPYYSNGVDISGQLQGGSVASGAGGNYTPSLGGGFGSPVGTDGIGSPGNGSYTPGGSTITSVGPAYGSGISATNPDDITGYNVAGVTGSSGGAGSPDTISSAPTTVQGSTSAAAGAPLNITGALPTDVSSAGSAIANAASKGASAVTGAISGAASTLTSAGTSWLGSIFGNLTLTSERVGIFLLALLLLFLGIMLIGMQGLKSNGSTIVPIPV